MLNYDKEEVRNALTLDNIYELLSAFGGDPEMTSFGIISSTICHNLPGVGSRKLYYYENSSLFHCYTGCEEPNFDIFQLVIKVMKIQYEQDFDLNEAIKFIALRFGISGNIVINSSCSKEDWLVLNNYDRIQKIELKDYHAQLKEYDDFILSRLNYDIRLKPWIEEGISEEVLKKANIGYFPLTSQITIPHYDKDGRFVGLRGRAMSQQDIDIYGKYRPVTIGDITYKHPLGMNLYGLNWCKDNIKKAETAIIFEGEKSVLKSATYFGWEGNISVACCGSSISTNQIQLLRDCGAKNIVVAFDRQFQKLGDDEYKKLIANYGRIAMNFKNYINVSFILDKKMATGYKDSPIDDGLTIFLQLYGERVVF